MDGALTTAVGDTVKIMAWYDNEWGFSNRLADVAAHIGSSVTLCRRPPAASARSTAASTPARARSGRYSRRSSRAAAVIRVRAAGS